MKNLDVKLSKNFSLKELVNSSTATRLKIDNTPDDVIEENLRILCQTVLQPVREKYGKTITISSGYRCKALNKAVGGSSTSQHTLGQAADITVGSIAENKKLFDMIVKMIKGGEITVGQLINEYGCKWIHISTPYKKVNEILNIG